MKKDAFGFKFIFHLPHHFLIQILTNGNLWYIIMAINLIDDDHDQNECSVLSSPIADVADEPLETAWIILSANPAPDHF